MKILSLAITSLAMATTKVVSAQDDAETNTMMTYPFDPKDTALLVIDPQNDFLSPQGSAWGVIGQSVTDNDTVLHLSQLFDAAYENGFMTFISPHYYYPHDHTWHFEGTLEAVMHSLPMFDRAGQLDLTGFEGSGADWLEELKPAIERSNVIITSPHKVYGPDNNDVMLQLRKQKINTIILAGMSSNLCVESHMRTLIENGFEVYVVMDATAGASTPELGDGYAAAVVNYKMISSGALLTADAIEAMGGLSTTAATVDVTPQSGGTRKFI
mmetsp:Transcript_58117/g.142074  ORF Transcript_58117/g.142074 Transcript_58117/m.142074 type:complete len:270 (-) Transcript_58117:1509-2318(-)